MSDAEKNVVGLSMYDSDQVNAKTEVEMQKELKEEDRMHTYIIYYLRIN